MNISAGEDVDAALVPSSLAGCTAVLKLVQKVLLLRLLQLLAVLAGSWATESAASSPSSVAGCSGRLIGHRRCCSCAVSNLTDSSSSRRRLRWHKLCWSRLTCPDNTEINLSSCTKECAETARMLACVLGERD